MDIVLIWVRRERKYFCKWDWTARIKSLKDVDGRDEPGHDEKTKKRIIFSRFRTV
jgi:hypothetical protein